MDMDRNTAGISSAGRISVDMRALLGIEPLSLSPFEKQAITFSDYMRHTVAILGKSRTARSLMLAAAAENTSVGLDHLLEPSCSYFYPLQNRIDLGYQPDILHRTEKGLGRYLLSFTAALRRAGHTFNGSAPQAGLSPQEFLWRWRLMEADVEAVCHLVAWELRYAGAGFLWRQMMSGGKGDIAAAFEEKASNSFPATFDGAALKCAFDQWFASENRMSEADHAALEYFDMALLERPAFALQNGIYAQLRTHISTIGLLPCGDSYLEGLTCEGVWYRAASDQVNTTHLSHIMSDLQQLSRCHASSARP